MATTYLSPNATPGKPYSFSAKTAAVTTITANVWTPSARSTTWTSNPRGTKWTPPARPTVWTPDR